MTLTRTARMISFETLCTDLWHAYRQILIAPGFSGGVILVLAAGFGISTAIFSTVRSVLLAPLPYNKPERLIQIVSRWPKTGDKNDWSAPIAGRNRLEGNSSVLPGCGNVPLLSVEPKARRPSGVGLRFADHCQSDADARRTPTTW
jgi:hypothetical protein